MKAGSFNSLVIADQKASFTSRRRWQLRKTNNRSSFARMPRTGIRTFRRSGQARDRTIYTGIKDSVTRDQQESLQGLARGLDDSRLTSSQLANPRPSTPSLRRRMKTSMSSVMSAFSLTNSGPEVEQKSQTLNQVRPIRAHPLPYPK
jgi:hypothetical protein